MTPSPVNWQEDEIARLRAREQQLREEHKDCDEVIEAYKSERDWLEDQLGQSRAQVQQLREALERIKNYRGQPFGKEPPDREMRKIAREALAAAERETE